MVGDSRIEMVEFKETVIARFHPLGIDKRRTFKSDRSVGNGGIILIGHGTDNRSSLRFGCGDWLGCRCTDDRHAENKEAQEMPGTHPPSRLFDVALVDFVHLCHSENNS
jgi:hypothetical protein